MGPSKEWLAGEFDLELWSRQGVSVLLELYVATHPGLDAETASHPRTLAAGLDLVISGDEHDYDHVDILDQAHLKVNELMTEVLKLKTDGSNHYETSCVVTHQEDHTGSLWI